MLLTTFSLPGLPRTQLVEVDCSLSLSLIGFGCITCWVSFIRTSTPLNLLCIPCTGVAAGGTKIVVAFQQFMARVFLFPFVVKIFFLVSLIPTTRRCVVRLVMRITIRALQQPRACNYDYSQLRYDDMHFVT